MSTSESSKWRLFWIVSIASLVADQATKFWARAALSTNRPWTEPSEIDGRNVYGLAEPVIDSFWHWRLSMNKGSAFGLFSSQSSARIFLSVVGVLAVIGMIYMVKKARLDQRLLHWALALLVGGAVGNLIDRVYYGVVTDFVLWHVGAYNPDTLHWEHEWPVFNIADIVLVVGVGLMFIDIQKEGRREKREKAAKLAQAGHKNLVP